MGCDIHAWIEVQRNGQWEWHAHALDDPEYFVTLETKAACGRGIFDFRCYACFGVLAGVRGEGPPIAKPRWMPQDANRVAYYEWDRDYDRGDAHSASWLLLSELLAVPREHEWCGGEMCFQRDAKELAALLPDKPENVRVVFFFDN